MKIIFIHGFLGSGKTSLVKKIITDYADKRIAVLVNELGDCDVDKALLESSEVPYYQANAGRLLGCLPKEKFTSLITMLIYQDYDYILVETSGFDDPITLSENMREIIEVASKKINFYSITVIDGIYFPKICSNLMLTKRHIQAADLLVLNKVDLLSEKQIRDLTIQVKKISKAALEKSEYCQIDSVLDKLNHTKKPIMYGQRKRNMDLRYFSLKVDNRVSDLQIHEFLGRIKDCVYRAKGILQLNDTKLECQMASKQISMTISSATLTNLHILYSSDLVLESEILEIYRYIVPKELWLL